MYRAGRLRSIGLWTTGVAATVAFLLISYLLGVRLDVLQGLPDNPWLGVYMVAVTVFVGFLVAHAILRSPVETETYEQDWVEQHPWKTLTFLLIGAFLLNFPAIFYVTRLSDDFHIVGAIVRRGAWTGLYRCWFEKTSYYRPLVRTTFFVEYFLSGTTPYLSHAHNVLVHGLRAFLAARIAAQLLPQPRVRYASMLAGAFCLLFPMNPEPVWCIAGRYDLYLGLCVAAAVCVFLRPRFGFRQALWVSVLGLMAVLSKESGLMVPVLLLAIFCLRFTSLDRSSRFWHMGAIAGSVAMCIAVVVFRYSVVHGGLEEGLSNRFVVTTPTNDRGPNPFTPIYYYFTSSNPIERILLPINCAVLKPEACAPLMSAFLGIVLLGALRRGPNALKLSSALICLAWLSIFIAPAVGFPLYRSMEGSRYPYAAAPAFSILLIGLVLRPERTYAGCSQRALRGIAVWSSLALMLALFQIINQAPFIEASSLVRSFAKQARELVVNVPFEAPTVLMGPDQLDNIKGAAAFRQSGNALTVLADRGDLRPVLARSPAILDTPNFSPTSTSILVWDHTVGTLCLAQAVKKNHLYELTGVTYPETPSTGMPTETHASAENVLSRNDLRASGFSDGWYAAEVFSTFAEGGSPVLRVADEGENGVRIACLDAPVTPGRFYRFCAVLRAPGRCFECVAIWVRNDFTDKRPFAEKHFVLGSGWTDCEIPFLTQQSDHIQILIGPTETTLPTMDAKEITLTEGLYQRAKYLWPRNMP